MMNFKNPPVFGYAPTGARLTNVYVEILGKGGLRLPNNNHGLRNGSSGLDACSSDGGYHTQDYYGFIYLR